MFGAIALAHLTLAAGMVLLCMAMLAIEVKSFQSDRVLATKDDAHRTGTMWPCSASMMYRKRIRDRIMIHDTLL
jgi:hypothetical protein